MQERTDPTSFRPQLSARCDVAATAEGPSFRAPPLAIDLVSRVGSDVR